MWKKYRALPWWAKIGLWLAVFVVYILAEAEYRAEKFRDQMQTYDQCIDRQIDAGNANWVAIVAVCESKREF